MQATILKEAVRGTQPVTIEDEMLQQSEVLLTEKVCRTEIILSAPPQVCSSPSSA